MWNEQIGNRKAEFQYGKKHAHLGTVSQADTKLQEYGFLFGLFLISFQTSAV